MGQIRDFFKSDFSTFGSIWKWSQSDPLWSQTYHPCSQRSPAPKPIILSQLDYPGDLDLFPLVTEQPNSVARQSCKLANCAAKCFKLYLICIFHKAWSVYYYFCLSNQNVLVDLPGNIPRFFKPRVRANLVKVEANLGHIISHHSQFDPGSD